MHLIRPDGGYRCQVPLGEVNLLQVIEAADGATDTDAAWLLIDLSAADPCAIRGLGSGANRTGRVLS